MEPPYIPCLHREIVGSFCTAENPGSGFVEALCESSTGILHLILHLTKPIHDVRDVQWAATEEME